MLGWPHLCGANGELRTKTVPGVGATTYSYDALGNLGTVVLPDTTVIDYVIDGQNRRVGRKVNGVLVKGWLYQNQLNPVAELDSGGTVVSRFVYGTRVNVPAYMIKGGNVYRFVVDHLGSVRLLVDTATGAVAQRIDYDEWGNITQNSHPGFQPFGFAGGLVDDSTNLLRFGARDYDPQIGRWTSADPLRFRANVANLYSYAVNDPVNLTDYSGLCPKGERFRPSAECAKDLFNTLVAVSAGELLGKLLGLEGAPEILKGLEESGEGRQLLRISHRYQLTSSASNALGDVSTAAHEMDMAQLASDRAAQLQRDATRNFVGGAALLANDVADAADPDLPWWAQIAAFIPEIGAAVPGGEAIGSCLAALELGLEGY